MNVGILKEIKAEENRVAMTPAGVEVMRANGHEVMVEKFAGVGSNFSDDQYIAAGAKIIDTADEIFASADMIVLDRIGDAFFGVRAKASMAWSTLLPRTRSATIRASSSWPHAYVSSRSTVAPRKSRECSA